ncbi:MAG: beta-lactamase family protein [Anaerolineales bacterium]|nr:beta-lactamase family protein [Anaerolineales bacterium]
MLYRYFLKVASIFTIMGLIFVPTSRQFVAAESYKELQEIDSYVLGQMKDLDIPGVAIGIVRGDQVVYTQGYGVADDAGRAMTSDTPFLIASLSKPITALGIMQLVEEGKINLDAPVQMYLPWFRVADEEVSSKITIRHLLHQTSGFDERESYVRNLSTDSSVEALEMSIRALNTAELNFAPGEAFEYTNTNYDILGLLIQTLSGQSYEQYIEEKIFDPLDMDQSYTSLEGARGGNMTRGYYPFFGITTAYDHLMPYSRIVKPSAGLFSSAEDLTHFLIAQLNQGQYQGNAILSEERIATLHTPGIQFSENAGYAMGWSVFSFPDMASVTPNNSIPIGLTHAGEWVGYTSLLVFIPELETGIVLLMNKHDPARMPEYFSIGWSLAMLAVGLEPLEPQSADFIGKNIRVLLAVVIVLLGIGAVWAVRKLRQLPSKSGSDSRQNQKLAIQMTLLAIVDLALAVGLLFIRLPESKDTIFLSLRFNPDIGLMYVLLLMFTLGWGTIRTLLFLRQSLKTNKLENAI